MVDDMVGKILIGIQKPLETPSPVEILLYPRRCILTSMQFV